MRWASYASAQGEERVGVVVGDALHGLPAPATLLGLLREGDLAAAGQRALREPAEVLALEGATLLAPVPTPPSVRDFMSFEDHVVTSMAAIGTRVDPVWYEQPVFYFTNPAAVVGPGARVPVAPGSSQLDFELEVAAVVGRGGADISPERAGEHIAGYTILCDWSARDLQTREMGVGLGPVKGKDTATGLGPHLVTPDEISSRRTGLGYDLAMSASVNGRPYSAGSWSSISWSFEQMVAYASRGTRLRPGDVLGSGTVGTGCILELARVHGSERYPWLVPGDVVELDVEVLGRLSGVVVPGSPVVPLS